MKTPPASLVLTNGLSVEVVDNGVRSKTLFFSRAARGIELTREECTRLSEMLAVRANGPRPMPALRKMLKEGYFNAPRGLSSIRDKLVSHGVWTQRSALNVLLKEMVHRGEIHRHGTKGAYRYVSADIASTIRDERHQPRARQSMPPELASQT